MSDGREMFLDYTWTELESYSTKYHVIAYRVTDHFTVITIIVLFSNCNFCLNAQCISTVTYVPPHQHLWTLDVLVCPLSVTERFLLQPLISGTVFRHTSLLPPLSPSSVVILNHISSHFLIPLSDSSLICTVPTQWLVTLDTLIACTFII